MPPDCFSIYLRDLLKIDNCDACLASQGWSAFACGCRIPVVIAGNDRVVPVVRLVQAEVCVVPPKVGCECFFFAHGF